MDTTLQRLFQGQDGKVSDRWSSYLAEYDRLFSDFRSRPINLFELGVQNGGSLEIWAQYFTKAARLIGCDINPDCKLLMFDDPRISVVVGDANNDETETAIVALAQAFDLVIDDGSHRSSDVVRSFGRYFPHVSDGGLFIVEDLHCSYWQEYEGGLYDPYSSMSFFKRLADVINHEHWGVSMSSIELLAGFSRQYGASFNEELLSHIHSIEFINSLCVIRKSVPDNNRLGVRTISGSQEIIVQGIRELNNTFNSIPAQSANPWTVRRMPPDEELIHLYNELAERDEQIMILKREAITEGQHRIQLFVDTGTGFSENNAPQLPVTVHDRSQEYIFDLSGQVRPQAIRLDPLNDSAVIVIERLSLATANGDIDLLARVRSNACITRDQRYFFETSDPQIFFADLGAVELSIARTLNVKIQYMHTARNAVHAAMRQYVAEQNKRVAAIRSDLELARNALQSQGEYKAVCYRAIAAIRDEHTSAIMTMSEQKADLEATYAQLLQALRAEHDATLAIMHNKDAEHAAALKALADREAKQNAVHEQLMQKLFVEHSSALDKMIKREAALLAEHGQALVEQREEHKTAVKTLLDEGSSKAAAYEKLLQTLRDEHARALDAMCEQHEIDGKHAAERQMALTQDHAREIAQMKDQYSALEASHALIEASLNKIRSWSGFRLLAWIHK
ncbi:MAG: class I SAM-dependent methyltransferase [Nitrospirota bacterium]